MKKSFCTAYIKEPAGVFVDGVSRDMEAMWLSIAEAPKLKDKAIQVALHTAFAPLSIVANLADAADKFADNYNERANETIM